MKSWSLTSFSYFLISLNLAIGLTRCDSNSNQKCLKTGGMITPAWRVPIPDVDIILEVGTPLEIYCTLDLNHKHAENYTSQNLVFKKGDRKIDSKHVTFVNSTTARLFLDTSTISVQTEIFACLLTLHGGCNNATSDVSNSSDSGTEMLLNNTPETPQEDLICSSSVRIGSKPKKVANFKCLSHNWDVLDCWWHEPNNGIATGYSIYYSIPGDAGEHQIYDCPTDQSEPGHCRWTKETSPPYKGNFEFTNFYINGSNMFGNITQKFRWHHYTHIIPAQPCNLTFLRTTSHSVCLQWDDVSSKNASLTNLPYLYLIKYKRPKSKSWNVIYFHSKDIEKENDRVQVNITGIKYPNMEYNFHVYVKFDVSKKNPWSKAASVVVKTSACAPYRSPKTDPGGFEVFAKYSNHRNAMIYWKQIPNEEHNGDNFLYRIIVFENDEKVNITPTSMNNFSATFSNLSFNAYKFYIRSVNAIGSAPRSSSVYVPKQNDILPRPNPDYLCVLMEPMFTK